MQQNHTEILLQQTISPQLSVNLSKIRTIGQRICSQRAACRSALL